MRCKPRRGAALRELAVRYLRILLLSLVALGALVVGTSLSATADTAVPVTIGSDSVLPGESATVALEALGVSQELGAATVDVTYDPAVVSITACTDDPGGVFDLSICNAAFAPDVIRFVGISARGVSGDLALADLTFQAIGSAGEVSPLDAMVQTFADIGGFDIPNTDQDGSIDILAGTPTPTPTPCPDADDDGFSDCEEAFVGTDPLDPCADTPDPDDEADDKWPADLNDDQIVNVLDIVQLTPPTFGTSPPDPNYTTRKDLNGDGAISILDVVRLTPPVFGSSCS